VTPERVEEARAQANQARAIRLKGIQERGKAAVAQAEALEREEQAYQAEETKATQDEFRLINESNDLGIEIKNLDVDPHPLDEQIATLVDQIAGLDEQIATAAPIDVAPLESEAKGVRASLAKLDAGIETSARIAELAAEQKRLGVELEQTDRELYLLDRYVQALATLTEAAVNDLFEIARFRLFAPQINGGVQQVCDLLVDGVPYGQGLNRGSEVRAGLDVIRTLSGFYGLQLPIWLDNRESVTKLLACESQMISLIVDERAKKLEVTCG
jgi:hypothetical protein